LIFVLIIILFIKTKNILFGRHLICLEQRCSDCG